MRALLFFIFIMVVFLVVYLGLQRLKQARSRLFEQDENAPADHKHATDESPEKMVACATCGLHLPEQEAICEEDTNQERHYYCSQKHRLADKEPNVMP
ncbi:MAG: PP0621 family protein [Hydrogenovibrio sp.]